MGADPAIVKEIRRLRMRFADTIPLERVILFGSRARGDARPDSDVDLILVSPAFEGQGVSQRGIQLHLAWDLDLPVDMICYTPAEFERLRGRVGLVRVALEEGIEVGS